ncbi:MAG: right-handed parallel beta-helix repeat-containing protein [Pirellulaceae bacterium]
MGLFWCWGVKYGLAEGNRIVDNRNYGISIGHNDTDNISRDNDIIGSGKVGILFRDDDRAMISGLNRNLVENNRIVNSGGPTGIAIDIQGKTKDVTVHGNEIRESRGSMERVGIRIAADAQRITLSDNRMEGLATDLVDLRS